MSDGQDLGVPARWNSDGSGWTGVDQGIYLPQPEHSYVIKFDPSYCGILFGGGVESENAPIQAMVTTARPGYHRYQGGAGIRKGK